MGLRKLWLGGLAIVLLVSASTASAQTTKPAANWPDIVNRLADIVRTNRSTDLTPLIERGTILRTFSSDALVPPEKLLGICAGCKALGVHAYLKSPTSLATDLSDDFKSADVPDALRHDMVIADTAAERPANDIAGKWIAQILQPTPDQSVGVIVLWRRDRADSFNLTSSNRPLFVLIKADLVDGQYVLRQITFGDPLEKKR